MPGCFLNSFISHSRFGSRTLWQPVVSCSPLKPTLSSDKSAPSSETQNEKEEKAKQECLVVIESLATWSIVSFSSQTVVAEVPSVTTTTTTTLSVSLNENEEERQDNEQTGAAVERKPIARKKPVRVRYYTSPTRAYTTFIKPRKYFRFGYLNTKPYRPSISYQRARLYPIYEALNEDTFGDDQVGVLNVPPPPGPFLRRAKTAVDFIAPEQQHCKSAEPTASPPQGKSLDPNGHGLNDVGLSAFNENHASF